LCLLTIEEFDEGRNGGFHQSFEVIDVLEFARELNGFLDLAVLMVAFLLGECDFYALQQIQTQDLTDVFVENGEELLLCSAVVLAFSLDDDH